MDFTHTEAQRELGQLTRTILDDHATNERLRVVETAAERFDRSLWTQLGASDVLGAALPESVGGGGCGLLEQCGVLVEVGRAVAPVPYLSGVVVAAAALAEFGTQRQRATWLPQVARGGAVLTAALVEPHHGPATVLSTSAQRDSAGWRLNGVKCAVPFGTLADLILVPAATPNGPAVFLVEPGDSGVSTRQQQVVDGGTESWLELTDVALTEDRLLGTGTVLDWMWRRTTIGTCALQLGVVERALELTAAYSRDRVQFERPIGSFQAVSQRLADGYIDVEAARLTLWQAAWLEAEGQPCDTEIATAKYWAAQAGHRVGHTAVHVHGGVGIDLDHPLHRYFVAAKHYEFALGGATIQLRRIGANLAAGARRD